MLDLMAIAISSDELPRLRCPGECITSSDRWILDEKASSSEVEDTDLSLSLDGRDVLQNMHLILSCGNEDVVFARFGVCYPADGIVLRTPHLKRLEGLSVTDSHLSRTGTRFC